MVGGVGTRINANGGHHRKDGTLAGQYHCGGNGGGRGGCVPRPRDGVRRIGHSAACRIESRGDNEAVVVGAEAETVGEIGVEEDGSGESCLGEVEFHGENVLRLRSDICGTDDAAVVIGSIASSCRSACRHVSSRHVISIHFLTVHVGDDSVAVVQTDFNSSHGWRPSKEFAEVLRRGSLLRCGGGRDGRPGGVGVEHILPGTRHAGLVLPVVSLVDGGVESKVSCLLTACAHHNLEHQIVILAVDGNPGT